MNLDKLMDPGLLHARIEEGYVKVRHHPTLPYRILNYSELAAYSRTWDEVTLQCRGLIVDDQNEVIARPFPKFFNDGEHDGDRLPQLDLSAPVEVTDKLDGSLGILYPNEGEWAIATRGSFESDQAKWATRHYEDEYADHFTPQPGYTYLFEIIYKANRIVVDYDFEDLVLLAVVDNEESISSGQRFEELIDDLPDEFHDWLTETWLSMFRRHQAASEKVQQTFHTIAASTPPGDRRAFAEAAKQHDNTSLLFCLYDGQHDRMKAGIWKQLKPRGDTFMLDHSEAVA